MILGRLELYAVLTLVPAFGSHSKRGRACVTDNLLQGIRHSGLRIVSKITPRRADIEIMILVSSMAKACHWRVIFPA